MGTEEPQRTGEEAELREDLKQDDQAAAAEGAGAPVADDPAGSREERRRSQFIDAHADEDGDPATSEQTYRDRQAGSSASVGSTPPTSSTTPTPPTTSD